MDYRLKTFRILGQQLPPCCISHYDPLGWEGSSFLAFLTSFYLHLKELLGCIEAHLHVEMTLLEKARRYDTSLQLLHQSHSLAKPYSWLTQNNPPSCGYHYRHSVHMTLNQVSAMASRKCWKYRKFYQLQHVAFAPIFANSVGQCKPNLLQVLWNLNLADHYAQTMLILSGSNMPLSSAPTTRKSSSTLGPTIHKNGQKNVSSGIANAHMELLSSFNLTCSLQYTKIVWAAVTQLVTGPVSKHLKWIWFYSLKWIWFLLA